MDETNRQETLIKKNEVLIKDSGKWLYFANPQDVIIAEKLEDVIPVLREVENRVQLKGIHAAGFVSYEAASAFDMALQTTENLRPERRTERLSRSSQSKDGFANKDPLGNRALTTLEGSASLRSHRPDALSGAREVFPFLWFGLYSSPRVIKLPKPIKQPIEELSWKPTTDRETYNTAIKEIRNYIADGRTYQVNYTMRLQTDFTDDAWNFFLHLAQSQNNHAAYIDIGRYVICSASPELFFQLDGDTIICRPMKGTVKRGRTTREDEEQSQWLKNSEKNRAENVMIVDMVRNDLGRIAKIGSVKVPELFNTERYPTLWQMTSSVTAQTSASVTTIFSSLFPSASITGAPKVGTMKIISELETTPRKIYTGSIGYIAPNRKAKFNVAIRTALIDRETQKAEYGVGGGIVWDSITEDEYAEALLKARVLTEKKTEFSLLETMLWTPEEGYYLREKHVTRMLDSAHYFDFPASKEKIEEYLKQISSQFDSPQRLRLLLDRSGILNSASAAFHSTDRFQSPTVRLARQPIDTDNVFLFHKTTHREIYELARKDFTDCDDVLLYNERGELTEFTIGNLVFELDGRLYTPPISCGVLAGTFRAHLLETGQIVERMIRVEELKDCTKIFMINSVRRWQQVYLVS